MGACDALTEIGSGCRSRLTLPFFPEVLILIPIGYVMSVVGVREKKEGGATKDLSCVPDLAVDYITTVNLSFLVPNPPC